MFALPLWIEATAGPDWLEAADRSTANALKWGIRGAVVFHGVLRNHQAHLYRVRGRVHWRLGRRRKAIRCFQKAIRSAKTNGLDYQRARCLLDFAAVKEEGREENRTEAIRLLKEMESVIPRAESWLLGDQYDEAVVAPEFDLKAWEQEHGSVTAVSVEPAEE
jgi:tetratricopeptide (TPR) repeat protein